MRGAVSILLVFLRLQVCTLLMITMSCFVQHLVFEEYTQ